MEPEFIVDMISFERVYAFLKFEIGARFLDLDLDMPRFLV